MARADLIRSLAAPAEQIEADLVDQLADASAALARLRARTPDDHDPAWSRHYGQAQNLYLKALAALEKHRKTHHSEPSPTPAPEPAPGPAASPEPAIPALNRQARRRLAAFHRASPDRRAQMVASWPGRAKVDTPRVPAPTSGPSPAPA